MKQVLYRSFSLLVILFSCHGSAYSDLLFTEPYTPKHTSTFMDKYDYIVVGAGSAGAIVASRLSEIPCVNVLLLEAGGEPPPLTEIPGLQSSTYRTHVDWQFKTVPQKHSCLGLENRINNIIAGKMLGGSSSINGMLYVRGNKKDYDDWAAGGAEGWSYNEVLPYFKKLEDNRNPAHVASGYHSSGGPVTVEDSKYKPSVKLWLGKAIRELGYEIVDSNGESQTGFDSVQGNTKNSRRCGTAKAYLVPAEKRPNLHIVTNAMVKKIIIQNQRAVGVEFDYKGKTYQVEASREVIVSAGAIKTPQLLMLSGVGPKEELEKFNIPVLADLPVGRNLHDHIMTLVPYDLGPRVVPIYWKLLRPRNIIEYITKGSGPYSALLFTSYMAFLRGSSTSQIDDDPNYQLFLMENTSAEPLRVLANLKPEVFDAYFGPYNFKSMLMCAAINIKPQSRGTITLNSTDIYDSPLIDPSYLENPRDYEPLVEAMKTCNRIMNTESMKKMGANPNSTVMPGCKHHVDNEESYFKCHLKQFTSSIMHFAGSAKMGDPRDPGTVVDPKLRVKNILGLRVADASIMPQVSSGNTNIPTMMIGEKAADLIKETIDANEQCENVNGNRKIISPPEEDAASKPIEYVKLTIEDIINISEQLLNGRNPSHAREDKENAL